MMNYSVLTSSFPLNWRNCREQIIFPEIDYDKVDRVRGLDITITTTAKSDEEGRALLAAFDFPFRK